MISGSKELLSTNFSSAYLSMMIHIYQELWIDDFWSAFALMKNEQEPIRANISPFYKGQVQSIWEVQVVGKMWIPQEQPELPWVLIAFDHETLSCWYIRCKVQTRLKMEYWNWSSNNRNATAYKLELAPAAIHIPHWQDDSVHNAKRLRSRFAGALDFYLVFLE